MQTISIAFRRIGGQEELDKEGKKFVKERRQGGGKASGGEATGSAPDVAEKTHEFPTERNCSP
jgi:hypothetical protein